jgi:hypothetical protein
MRTSDLTAAVASSFGNPTVLGRVTDISVRLVPIRGREETAGLLGSTARIKFNRSLVDRLVL